MSEHFKNIPRPSVDELSTTAKNAIQAADRAAEKLRDQKRKLGQKLVIYADGKVQTVEP